MVFKSGDAWQASGGNPLGRPKKKPGPPPPPPPPTVKEVAREASPEAIEFMVKVMRDPANPLKDRMFAANTILDRGWGKPTQMVEATVSTFEKMSDVELINFLTGGQIIEGELVDESEEDDEGADEGADEA